MITSPPTTVARASTEPTERSIPPSRITNVIPTAITVLMLIWVKMFVRFASEANRGAKKEKRTTISRRARPMPASRINSWKIRRARMALPLR